MKMGTSLLLTNLAWAGASSTLKFLQEKFLNDDNKFIGQQVGRATGARRLLTLNPIFDLDLDYSITEEFIYDNLGKKREEFSGEGLEFNNYDSARWIVEPDKDTGFRGIPMAYLVDLSGNKIQNSIAIPCIGEYPIINMETQPNNLPIASNDRGVSTNILVRPRQIVFEYPITYWKVYGTNNAGEIRKIRNTSLKEKIKKAWNYVNPISALDIDEANDQYKQREIPTVEQIVKEISYFHNNKPFYLYLGFYDRIKVVPNIKIKPLNGQMDCVWISIVLTEIQEANIGGVGTSTTGSKNVGSVSGTTVEVLTDRNY